MKTMTQRDVSPRSQAGGFTLIEILMVMAIMTIMMGMALVAFVDWGRDAKLRTAERNFRTAFHHARQDAITHRRRTYLVYGNILPPAATDPTRGWYAVTTNIPAAPPAPPDFTPEFVIGSGDVIADGVLFGEEGVPSPIAYPHGDVQYIEFRLDGSCDQTGTPDWSGNQKSIVMFEARSGVTTNYLSTTITVYRLTGTILRREQE